MFLLAGDIEQTLDEFVRLKGSVPFHFGRRKRQWPGRTRAILKSRSRSDESYETIVFLRGHIVAQDEKRTQVPSKALCLSWGILRNTDHGC